MSSSEGVCHCACLKEGW